MFKPDIFDLSKNDNNNTNNFNTKYDIYYSRFPSPQIIKYGYNNFIQLSKTRLYDLLNQEKYKDRNFYLVTSPFEVNFINKTLNSEIKDIEEYSKEFFKNKNFSKHIEFYKIWEIMFLFPNLQKNKLKCSIKSDINDCKDCIEIFREKYFKKQTSNISIKQMLDQSNLVIVSYDNKYNKKHEEIEYLGDLIKNVNSSLKILAKDGCLVIKIYECFTIVTVKILFILSSIFKKFHIFKPYISRDFESEKYAIFEGYQDKKTNLNDLEKYSEKTNNVTFLTDFLEDLEIDLEFEEKIINSSLVLYNKFYASIHKMINYINSNNYYSLEYNKFLEEQKKASEFWKDTFFN